MTKRYYDYQFTHKPTGVVYDAQLEIDTDELARKLAARAMGSKKKAASSMGGVIKLKARPK